jgi:hypothetical protein
MRIIDLTLRHCVPGLGVDRRWLRERLEELDVRIPLCEGCVQELLNEADAASRRRLAASHGGLRYLDVLREEIVARAQFVHRWTATDEPVDASAEGLGTLVRIARKYALPRPWKLHEAVAAESTRRTPVYWHWAGAAAPARSAR